MSNTNHINRAPSLAKPSPSQMNVNEPSNRCPPFDVLSRLLGRGKTSTLSNQRCSSPCTTFIFLLFTPLALFLARLSGQLELTCLYRG